MQPEMRDWIRRLRFNDQLLDLATGGFTAEHWSGNPMGEGGNSAHWVLGHLTVTRRMVRRRLAELTGATPSPALDEAPWEAHFRPGADGQNEAQRAAWPGVDELRADFRGSSESLAADVTRLSEDLLAADWGRAFPDGATTIGAGLQFLGAHECYHLGQVGLLRRQFGLAGFA